MDEPMEMPCTETCNATLYEHRIIDRLETRVQHGENPEHSRVFTDREVWVPVPPTVPVRLASGKIIPGVKVVMDWLVELHEYQEALE